MKGDSNIMANNKKYNELVKKVHDSIMSRVNGSFRAAKEFTKITSKLNSKNSQDKTVASFNLIDFYLGDYEDEVIDVVGDSIDGITKFIEAVNEYKENPDDDDEITLGK